MSYATELAFAKNLALEAGGIMRQYFKSEELGVDWKEDNTPLTIADTTINKLVIEQVKAAFPKHGILGEEENYKPERENIWVVDPIDGTVPFSLGMPVSTFLLALVSRKDGQPVVAVTYDPFLEELFHATKGGGAFVNDQPIKTSQAQDLTNGYVFLGLSSLRVESGNYSPSRALLDLQARGAKVFNIQSGAYFHNRIAAGQLVGAIVTKIGGAWDVAATALIVQEAGGVVTDLIGERRRFDELGVGCIFAANQAIFDQLMEVARVSYENSRH